jgi:hypothetical protein
MASGPTRRPTIRKRISATLLIVALINIGFPSPAAYHIENLTEQLGQPPGLVRHAPALFLGLGPKPPDFGG